ncbi:MAG: recombination mediator RecR [Desulfosalsimonadaceae bacterium]
MQYYPESMNRLIRSLCRLPGIGEKSAERLAMHLLQAPEAEVSMLAKNIGELKKQVSICSSCFSLSDTEKCRICRDPSRNASLVCVVESPPDMAAIEKSGAFTGIYHILQGLLSPMDGIGPSDIRIAELVEKVAAGNLREIIIATATNIEGEATAAYIMNQLKPFTVKITRIASGVPMGGELKYVDQVTLKKALEARYDI